MPPITTNTLYQALLGHYRKPGETRTGEVLLAEVPAPNSSRRCDLLRISTWASRGAGIDVHEIKTSRADWQRELDDPAKAEAWWPYCSRMWVAAPNGVVHPEELPEGWGLLTPPTRTNQRRFKTVVAAATKKPELSVGLMTELVARADNARLTQIERAQHAHRQELHKARQEARAEAGVAKLPPDTRAKLRFLEDLEKALGADLSAWSDYRPGNLTRVTASEVAAALADFTRDHALLGRRAESVRQQEASLRRVAADVLANTPEETR